MRRDVAPEDRVEQLTLSESYEATDEESVAYVTARLDRSVPQSAATAEPACVLEALALDLTEHLPECESMLGKPVDEHEDVAEAFWAIHPFETAPAQ